METIVCVWTFPSLFKHNVERGFLPIVGRIKGVSRATLEGDGAGPSVFVRIEFCNGFYDDFRQGRKLQKQIRGLAAEFCAIDLEPQVLPITRYIDPEARASSQIEGFLTPSD